MAQKTRLLRRIDELKPGLKKGGGQLLTPATPTVSAPDIPEVAAPEDITVVNETLLRTTLVPKVLVEVEWNPPPNLIPELYQVEAAKDVNFTISKIIRATTSPSIALELDTDTDYWIRVQAVVRGVYGEYGYASGYPTVSIHTSEDTTPPDAITVLATNWTTDDLRFTWTNPSSSNYLQARVRIYDTFGGTLFKEVFVVGTPGSSSQYIFTADENNRVTANNPLTSVYYEILAFSIGGVAALTSATGTVTKARPTVPTGLTSTWSGDNGTYDESVTLSWTAVTGVSKYRVIVDGVTKEIPRTQYTYTYSENVSDHRPTLVSGDYALTYTVQAMNGLGQLSGGASGTATNIAPQSSNLALTTIPGFSSLYAYVTPTTEILDLYGYNWVLKSGGVNVKQVITFTPEVSFTTLNGAYQLQVYAMDKFGQKSATLSGSVTLDGLTIEQLRAETQYTNSLGTNPTTLAGLKNDNLVQSVVTISSGTTWQWTKAERPLLDRYHAITLAVSGAATNMPRVYYGLSADDSTYTWFSGPLVATGATGQSTTLTSYANETLAQNNAVLITNINRHDLPTITEARYVKMGHRGNTHHLTEYYPRRMIETDDLRAENVKSINIAAANVLADHIFVINLQAVSAQMGALHMDGIIDITTAGGIYQGTGSFASPTTGLKIYNTSGIGRMTLYSGGVAQIDTTTNGIFTAGAGAVRLTASGISIYTIKTASEAITGYPQYQLRWLNRDNTSQLVAAILGEIDVGDIRILRMFSYAPTSSQDSTIRLYADSTTRAGINTPGLTITNSADLGFRTVDIDGQDQINLNSALTTISDNLDLDGVVVGQFKLQYAGGTKNFLVVDDTAANADVLLSLQNSGDDISTGSSFILATKGATTQFQVRGDGRVNVVSTAHYAVGGTQVLSTRKTGWAAATNTKSRATFDTTTVTLPNLAARVGALIDDLISHGAIGA